MIALWTVLGGLLGAVNGVTRWWTVSRLRAGRRADALLWTLGGMAIRLGLVAGLLIAAFRDNPLAGFAAAGGLLLTRSLTVIWVHTRGWSRLSGTGESEGCAPSKPPRHAL